MHADCRRLFVSHHTFRYDRVYDERTSSRDVYAGSVAPLVALAASSKSATVLMYGQTGSGKTFTMRAIFEAAAADLFAAIDVAAGDVITCAYAELAQLGTHRLSDRRIYGHVGHEGVSVGLAVFDEFLDVADFGGEVTQL
jgi:kinesin family protein 2/24